MPVVSLVFGILGTIICLVPGMFTYGIPIAAIALVTGILGRKAAAAKQQGTGLATAGIVLGAVGLCLGIAMYVMCAKITNAVEDAANDPKLQESLKKMEEELKKAPASAK
ncbi:DUF4190 domain-containing protein [Myxococcota bacterium]|nr:DUF4190 domain-containing protein [Myxococcota bacterium]